MRQARTCEEIYREENKETEDISKDCLRVRARVHAFLEVPIP